MKNYLLFAFIFTLVACGNNEPNEAEIKEFVANVNCELVDELDEHPTLVKRAIQHCNSIKARESRYKPSKAKEW